MARQELELKRLFSEDRSLRSFQILARYSQDRVDHVSPKNLENSESSDSSESSENSYQIQVENEFITIEGMENFMQIASEEDQGQV